jgi:uncharacterized membrane protein
MAENSLAIDKDILEPTILEPIVVDPIMAIHIITGFGAIFIGIALIFLVAKDSNKQLGRFWQLTMLIMLVTSFDIRLMNSGSFSPIHGISILALAIILLEIWAGFTQRIKIQKISMRASFVLLILIFGAIMSTSGGVINQWFFA